MSTTTSPITFEEFEKLPDLEAGKRELIDGEIIEMPPPKKKHSEVVIRITAALLARLGTEQVRPDPTGYRIGDGWAEPDVSVIWPEQKSDDSYHVGAPMVAVEVLSPGEDFGRKVMLYFHHGAKEVWVLDYEERTMFAFYRRDDSGDLNREDVNETYFSGALQIGISLDEIFG